MHLGSDVLVPDLAGWRRDRVPAYLSGAAWEIAPDWVCEVLSPHSGDEAVRADPFVAVALPLAALWL